MSNTYNIYKINFEKINELISKIVSVGLVEQKKQIYDNYEMTFYFSEDGLCCTNLSLKAYSTI